MERVCIKYDPKNNLPTHDDILPNQTEKEARALEITVCVTNEDNHNLTTSQKELLRCHFRLGNIGVQHVQWFINTGNLKLQGKSKSVANFERTKCADCTFGKGRF